MSIWSQADSRAAAAKLKSSERIDGNTLGAWGSHSASLWKRNASGEAELHRTKADVLIVREGSATFAWGGSIVGAHSTAAGELRGASISGGQTRRLAPGDVVHVPANTPHQFLLDKGESITYLAFKIAR